MKSNKLIILMLIAVIWPQLATAQPTVTCPAGTGLWARAATWDWEDLNCDNWKVYSTDGQLKSIASPFDPTNQNASEPIQDINERLDYKKTKGWVLMQKNFGETGAVNWPFFILYNKHNGMLRVFVYGFNSSPKNFASVIMRWSGNNTPVTSLLNQTNNMLYANSWYHSGSAPAEVTKDVYEAVVLNYSNNNWFFGEFNMNFDEYDLCEQSTTRLTFEIQTGLDQTINLDGNIQFSTSSDKQVAMQGENTPQPTTDGSGNSIRDGVYNANKFIGSAVGSKAADKIGTTAEYLKEISHNLYSLDTNRKALKNFGDKMGDLSGASKASTVLGFLSSASKLIPGPYGTMASTAFSSIGMLVSFMGKSNEGGAPPSITYSYGSISLSGSIKTKTSETSITFQLPGTNLVSTNPKPFYNKPLGVIGLKSEPQLGVRDLSFYARNLNQSENFTCDIPCPPNTACYKYDCLSNCEREVRNNNPFYSPYKSIRINSLPILSINKEAKVVPMEIQACLSVKTNESYLYYAAGAPVLLRNSFNTLFEDVSTSSCSTYTQYGKTYKQCKTIRVYKGQSTHISNSILSYSPIVEQLENGYFDISSYNSNSGEYIYSTKFMDIQNFKGTSIIMPSNAVLMLKILMRYKVENDPSNEVYTTWNTYVLPQIAENDATNAPYQYSTYQMPVDQKFSTKTPKAIELVFVPNGNIQYNFNNSPITRQEVLEYYNAQSILNRCNTDYTPPGGLLYGPREFFLNNPLNQNYLSIEAGLIEGEYITTKNAVKVEPSVYDVDFKAYRVHLKSGFSTKTANGKYFKVSSIKDRYFTPETAPNLAAAYTEHEFTTCPTAKFEATDTESDVEFQNLAEVFPNPNKGNFLVLLKEHSINAKVAVYDARGVLIHNEVLEGTESNISLKNAVPGIYLLQIVSGDMSLTKKIYVE